MTEKNTISYSAIRRFCNCRKSFKFRYINRIEPIYASDALSFGKLIHECLEAHYKKTMGGYMKIINENYPNIQDAWQAKYNALAHGMMLGYGSRYKDKDAPLHIIGTEVEYNVPIINPKTGRHSKKFRMHGFIDMVTQDEHGDIWLWEHKTTALLDASYIERIWHDLQTMIYVVNFELMYKKKVKGIIYNVMQKINLKQASGETQPEYEKRLADLIAKSKTGKSSAKRKMPEEFKDYKDRLSLRYLDDASLYHREYVLVDKRRIAEIRQELWDVVQDIGQCKNYYKNRSQCHGFGLCEFFKICNSGDNPLIIENYYKEREDDTANREKQEENKPF